MIMFYGTLALCWYLTKIFWSKKAANYSLIPLIALAILFTPAVWQDTNQGFLNVGTILSFAIAFGFFIVNVLALVIGIFIPKKYTPPEEEKIDKVVYPAEEKAKAQASWLEVEAHYKSFKKTNKEPQLYNYPCVMQMLEDGELKSSSGQAVTASTLEKLVRFKEVTDLCFKNGLNPKDMDDREVAEALLDLDTDETEDEDDSWDWDDSPSESTSKKKSSSSKEEYGNYVIQYRDQVGGSWIDGPGSNDERTAESMFDRFIRNDSRGNRRCRLVKKVNGRVQSVLSTN